MSNISYLVQDLMKIIETHKQTLLPNAYSDLTATLDWHSADRFSTLAPEILMVIFSKVKRPGDLLSLTKTCKNFDNILSTHDSCWRSLAESKFPSNSGLSLQELYDEVQKIDIVKELHDEMRNMGASEEMCADIKINILNDWKWLACTLFHTMKPMQLDGYDHAYQLGKWWKMCIASTRPTYKAGAKVCILAGNYINTINDGEYTLGNVCWSGNKIVFEDEGILRYKGMLKGTELYVTLCFLSDKLAVDKACLLIPADLCLTESFPKAVTIRSISLKAP